MLYVTHISLRSPDSYIVVRYEAFLGLHYWTSHNLQALGHDSPQPRPQTVGSYIDLPHDSLSYSRMFGTNFAVPLPLWMGLSRQVSQFVPLFMVRPCKGCTVGHCCLRPAVAKIAEFKLTSLSFRWFSTCWARSAGTRVRPVRMLCNPLTSFEGGMGRHNLVFLTTVTNLSRLHELQIILHTEWHMTRLTHY